MKIGIDVGGTNTDAVLMDGSRVVAGLKSPTTEDVSSGVEEALRQLQPAIGASKIDSLVIGTTQFTNAFVQGKDLSQVAVLRIGSPATHALPPLCAWPEHLLAAIGDCRTIVRGGHNVDGRRIAALDERAVAAFAREIRKRGIKAASVTSVFAPATPDDEHRAAEIILNEAPDTFLTMSHTTGRLGLLERENAATMNASLAALSKKVVRSFEEAIASAGLNCPFYISQNDGTVLDSKTVAAFPVLTFASGPTNSMRGAALLSGARDAIIADIGGTTSDIGAISNGYPRESTVSSDIGGVKTNFRMPDVFALGLGGGSLVRTSPDLAIGPISTGHALHKEALVFGGSTLTASDIVVAAGLADFGDRSRVAYLDTKFISEALQLMNVMFEAAVEKMRTSNAEIPIILVGGGVSLISSKKFGPSEIIIPENSGVANAVGAALAQIGGEFDQIILYADEPREQAVNRAKAEATAIAIGRGAVESSIEIVDVEEVPLNYVDGDAVRLRVKAVGDFA